jgi:hypothetical protein
VNKKQNVLKGEHGSGVTHPALLDILTHTANPVEQALQRPKDRMKKRPLTFKHVTHENADRLRYCNNEAEEDHDLCDTGYGHLSTSKSLRPQQRVQQVNEQKNRRNPCNRVIYGLLLKAVLQPS